MASHQKRHVSLRPPPTEKSAVGARVLRWEPPASQSPTPRAYRQAFFSVNTPLLSLRPQLVIPLPLTRHACRPPPLTEKSVPGARVLPLEPRASQSRTLRVYHHRSSSANTRHYSCTNFFPACLSSLPRADFIYLFFADLCLF
jgi:hypothetical protein